MSQIAKVLSEELKIANIFNKLGYFTRFHINIYPFETTTKVSDIDVFAIKFDESLLPNVILIEVKEQSNKFSDLFKLYGFKKYFGDCKAVFVTGKVHPRTIPVADILNINLMSFDKLKELVKNVNGFEIEPLSVKDGLLLFDNLKSIKDIDHELYWNYHYLYVERDPFKRFFYLQKMFEKTSSFMGADNVNNSLLWFRKELFMLSFLAIIEISAKSIGIDDQILESYIESNILNVGIPFESKQKFKSNLNILITEIKKIGLKLDIEDIQITPKYLPDLIKIVKKFIRSGKYVQSYLQINEIIYRLSLKSIEKHISEIVSEKKYAVMSEINSIVLKILHNNTIESDFSIFL